MDSDISIINTQIHHSEGIYDTIRLAFGVSLNERCHTCISEEDVRQQLQRFPEGQFVAIDTMSDGLVVGNATTMRTSYPPTEVPKRWMKAIGSLGITNHEADGEWLYGVEMAVRPSYHRRGIGTALYEARFDLIRRLNLKGWYAGGVLMGYRQYQATMSPREYGEKVIQGEIVDPTVTMQQHRGFELRSVIENYYDEPDAGDAAVLIVWENPEYRA